MGGILEDGEQPEGGQACSSELDSREALPYLEGEAAPETTSTHRKLAVPAQPPRYQREPTRSSKKSEWRILTSTYRPRCKKK